MERVGELFAEMTVHDSREAIKRALAAAREELGIEIAYRSAAGPGEQGLSSGSGAGMSVPVRASDGRTHGTLVCGSGQDAAVLDSCDVKVVRVLARVVADQLDREEREMDRWRAQAEATGPQALLAAVQARDSDTGRHSQSVVELSGRVAGAVGLSARGIEEVERVALLHDVGKVAVPDRVLHKPAPLDPYELELIRRHTLVGARIVRSIPPLAHLAPAVRASHERWDGAGYPDGLYGERIPLASRITFVCDAYDAMTSDRPYRRALSRRAALAELNRATGTQFCRRAAGGLLQVLAQREGRPAGVRRLRSAC